MRHRGTITIDADVDIDDVLREIDTKELQEELDSRDDKKETIISYRFELRKHLLDIMGLKKWHTKERLIKEIEELFD